MKVSVNDLLAILRRFDKADETRVPREIDQVTRAHPNAINQLVSFRFDRAYFHVLFDDTAEDREDYILKQIRIPKPYAVGAILENPTSDLTTYGLPFKGKDTYLFQEQNHKKRLDVLLAERHPETSRSTWQKHIKAGNITVNDKPAKNAKQEVIDADSIAINIPAGTDFSQHELPIIYLDDDVIVVNKPAGILTHSKGALNDEFTVADFFRRYTTDGLDTSRPGIVHRLDRDTSGVIIGGRTPEACALLKAQFSERKAKKWYLAVVDGHPAESEAVIDLPIGRNPKAPSTFRVDSKGKAATTEYVVLKSQDKHSLVRLHPLTGRTHQLRVHMQYLRTPILGDRVYGKVSQRLYLHAYRLEITIKPGVRKTFNAPIPAAFTALYGDIDDALLG